MSKSSLSARDENLLQGMMSDMQTKEPVYRPGVYWESKTKAAARAIKENGYKNFRSARSVVGLSYADNPQIYYAPQLSPKRQAVHRLLRSVPIVRDIVDGQCHMTSNLYKVFQRHQQHIVDTSPEIARLTQAYNLGSSSSFGSENEVSVGGQTIAAHYLELCQQMDAVREHVDLTKVESVFEIGGGFGTMAHILLQNFPNIKTYIYLDIPPNLFIGTQYLRSLYPEAVYDYSDLKDKEEIIINNEGRNGGPAIYCIAPWQIENLRGTIDLFYNSHSFVEMTESIVSNYAQFIKKISGPHTQYALVTYDGGKETSLRPHKLPEYFPHVSFEAFEKPLLFSPWRKNFYVIGKCKQN